LNSSASNSAVFEEADPENSKSSQVQWISDGRIVRIFTPDEFPKFREFLQENPTLGTSASNILNSSASNFVLFEEADPEKSRPSQVKWISDVVIVRILTPDEFLKFREFLQENPTLGTSASNILNSSASNSVDSTIVASSPSNVATESRNPDIFSESSGIGNTSSNILEPLVFNKSRVDFRKVNCFELNFQAFETKTTCFNQSGQPFQTEQVATTLQNTNPPTIVPKGEWSY
jgi:hypothetical protein